MSALHTPGPWVAKQPKAVLGCDPRGQWYVHAKDCTVACTLDGDRAANAHLIAAAPELLAALRLYVERETELHGDMPVGMRGATDAARAAIAKATGSAA